MHSIIRAVAHTTILASLAACGGQEPQIPDEEMAAFIIDVPGGRAEMVSGGDALVAVAASKRNLGLGVGDYNLGDLERSRLVAELNGRDVSASFQSGIVGERGRAYMARLDGLEAGANQITVRFADGPSRSIALVNFPRTGPIFSGPHEEPFVCETLANDLGEPVDANCSIETKVDYYYLSSSTGELQPFDPQGQRPDDIATTTTSDGESVPFIYREETGTINRAIYQILILDDPAVPGPDPWNSYAGWNRRLVYGFGGGCGPGHRQANLVAQRDLRFGYIPELLGKGYAVAISTLNVGDVRCNDVVSAETAMMVKERFSEAYGVPAYTISRGGSGGAMQQYMIADNYPGILDGIIPGAAFLDNSFLIGAADCTLLVDYWNNTDIDWTEDQKRAVSGFGHFGDCVSWAERLSERVRADICPEVIERDAVYHPEQNPEGVRCSHQDNYRNILQPDPATGRIPPLHDNVGLQYGLDAWLNGTISFDQFAHLNSRVGGFGPDGQPVSVRSRLPDDTSRSIYRTGRIIQAGAGLSTTPIIDTRPYFDLTPNIHDSFPSHSMRARLRASNGHAENQVLVVYEYGTDPGDHVDQMDRWLRAIRDDRSEVPLAQKVVRHRPTDVSDACFRDDGTKIQETIVPGGANECSSLFPVFGDPRMAAGAPIDRDIVKCSLRDVDADNYPIQLEEHQLNRLRGVFPDGVCDWTRPGVGQSPLSGTWRSYAQ